MWVKWQDIFNFEYETNEVLNLFRSFKEESPYLKEKREAIILADKANNNPKLLINQEQIKRKVV